MVKLLGLKENTLAVENLDILDGTPLLDIKPYVPDFVLMGMFGQDGWKNSGVRSKAKRLMIDSNHK